MLYILLEFFCPTCPKDVIRDSKVSYVACIARGLNVLRLRYEHSHAQLKLTKAHPSHTVWIDTNIIEPVHHLKIVHIYLLYCNWIYIHTLCCILNGIFIALSYLYTFQIHFWYVQVTLFRAELYNESNKNSSRVFILTRSFKTNKTKKEMVCGNF